MPELPGIDYLNKTEIIKLENKWTELQNVPSEVTQVWKNKDCMFNPVGSWL